MDDPSHAPLTRVAIVAVLMAAAGATAGFLVGQTLGQDDPSAEANPLAGPGWRYHGIKQVAGPGSTALPLLPLEADEGGRLAGDPTITTRIEGNVEDVTLDVLPWFRYCGFGDAPGLQPNWTGDDVLRYYDPARSLDRGGEPVDVWYAERDGEPIRPDDVPVGHPVYATWRTPDDATPKDRLYVSLLKRNESDLPTFPFDLPFSHDGIVAWASIEPDRCTHTFTQPIPWEDRHNETRGSGRHHPDLQGVPHPVRSTVHLAAWDPNRVVEDRWTGLGFPTEDGGTTGIPPAPGGD